MGNVGGAFFLVSLLTGALLLAGYAVWGLLGLVLLKEITCLEAILYTAAFCALVGLGILGFGGPMMWASAAACTALGIGFPLVRKWGNDRALDRIDEEDIAQFREGIRKRPEIPYPYRRLAEIYAKRKDYQAALNWYGEYLKRVPQDESEVRFRIRRLVELLEKSRAREKLCPECRKVNQGDARYCVHCGAIMPGWWEVVAAFRGPAGRRYLLTVAVVTLVLGTVLGSLTALHPLVLTLLFWIAAAAFVYYLYKRVTAT